MPKHSKKLYKALCSELTIEPYSFVYGTEVKLEEDVFNDVSHKVFLYLKRHKSAVKEIGHGMFAHSNDELKRLAKLYIIKFGCKPIINET